MRLLNVFFFLLRSLHQRLWVVSELGRLILRSGLSVAWSTTHNVLLSLVTRPNTKKEVKAKKVKKVWHDCEWCEYRGKEAKLLRMHIRRHHPEHFKDLRICDICSHRTRSQKDMSSHVQLNHPEHFFSKDRPQPRSTK